MDTMTITERINNMTNPTSPDFSPMESRIAMMLWGAISDWKRSNARVVELASRIKKNMEYIIKTCEDTGSINAPFDYNDNFDTLLTEAVENRRMSADRIDELCWILNFGNEENLQLWIEIKEDN